MQRGENPCGFNQSPEFCFLFDVCGRSSHSHLDADIVIAGAFAEVRSACRYARALMVWPVGLIAILAPFSDAVTPGGTAPVTTSG